jgi:Tol biopolymer transport system component
MEMKKVYICTLLFLWILTLASTSIQASGGIAFTRSEFTLEGFEESISKSRVTRRGWWELHRRDICIINPDGTGLRQLTDDGVSYGARWSRDGGKIAFYSGAPPAVSLYVMNADGSDRIELISNQSDIYDFDWSPDGTKILAYIKSRSTRDPEETWIVTVEDEGQTKRMGSSEWARGWNHWAAEGATVENPSRRLIDGLPEGLEWPEWSPDNNHIAFIHKGRLAIEDATTIGMLERWRPSRLEPPCDRIGDWSPDGSRLLFFAGGNVCSINADETNPVNLSMARADDACWSPDGSQIAFISTDGRKRNTEIFIMNADGSRQQQLTNTNYFHTDVDWR